MTTQHEIETERATETEMEGALKAMLHEALAQNERMRAAIKTECHRLEDDWNAADVTEARRALLAAAAF